MSSPFFKTPASKGKHARDRRHGNEKTHGRRSNRGMRLEGRKGKESDSDGSSHYTSNATCAALKQCVYVCVCVCVCVYGSERIRYALREINIRANACLGI